MVHMRFEKENNHEITLELILKKRICAKSLTWKTVPMNKYIYAKVCLYHNIDLEKKKTTISLLRI